jgi:hypothetical protein
MRDYDRMRKAGRAAPASIIAACAVVWGCGSRELMVIDSPADGGGSSSLASGGSSNSTAKTSSTSASPSGPREGGAPADASTPSDGASDAGAGCKRGVATNAAPSASLLPSPSSPGIAWWYDWAAQPASGGAGASLEFVPMIWGGGSLGATLPAASRYVLGFNEPNFTAQANLTPAQAAADWPRVQAAAAAVGARIVSPGLNYCGSASNTSQCSDPSVTDPYTWLKDFFADCAGCQVDAIAVHWYNCDLPSLKAYLEGNVDAGGGLQGFTQFGKPIWLTEFSCDSTHSAADQKAYMQAAVPYLENDPNVFRYSWFNATAIPNAQLMNSDGSLTDLGTTYVSLPQSCP